MKLLIVYSSVTGNTRRLAEGIARELADLQPAVADIQTLDGLPAADVYLVGYWADKGHADDLAAGFIRRLKNVKVGLFGTLGAYPYGKHARMIQSSAEELLDASCECVGSFLCQGPVALDLLARMKNRVGTSCPAADLRHRIAAGHPNADDMRYAAGLFRERICPVF